MDEQIRLDEAANDPVSIVRTAQRPLEVIRWVLIGVTVLAGLYVARGYFRLFADWRDGGRAPAFNQGAAADPKLNSMAPMLPLAGQWSFAELEWDVKSTAIKVSEIDARLESLSALPPPDHAGQLPEASDELFQLVELLEIQPVERAGNQIYRIDRNNLKGLLVVRNVGDMRKAVAIAAAYPDADDQWQFVELTPRQATGNTSLRAEHLLPLPAGAKRSGGRYAADGSLLLELVTLESNGGTLTSAWKVAGWEVRPTGLGGPNAFSYLCARGDEVIYVWSASPPESVQNLMLVRTSSPADTNP